MAATSVTTGMTNDERLAQLANAYGCEPSLAPVADAMIERLNAIAGGGTALLPGPSNDKAAVIESLKVLISSSEAWAAMSTRGDIQIAWTDSHIPAGVITQAREAAAAAHPTVNPERLVGLMVGELRAVLLVDED